MTTFYANDDKYIWALVVDGHGNLFAGTGDKGIIYKIAPDGKGAPFYKTNATHVTALAFDRAGNLLVGTGSPGRVLRVDPDGKGFVLLDSPFQEIRSLRFDDQGALYVAALSGRASAGAGPTTTDVERTPADATRTPVPSVSAEITSISIVDVGTGPTAPAPREDRRAAKGAVYRIQPDGVWDELWESRDDSPYDLAFDVNGALLIGTGNKGKLYRLEGEPLRPTLADEGRRAADHRLLQGLAGPAAIRNGQPGQVVPASPRDAHLAACTNRRPRRADGLDLGAIELARIDAIRQPHRALHAFGQHGNAGRDLESVVVGVHELGRVARSRAPRRDTCSGEPS